MTFQYAVAALIFFLLAAFVARLQIAHRREIARRSQLPPQERQRLEQEDAIWSQRYGF